MRRLSFVSLALAASLAAAANVAALERASMVAELVRDDIGNPAGWGAGSTCSLLYANYCTDCVYRWRCGSGNTKLFGQIVSVADCCGPNSGAVLLTTVHRARECVMAGYGYTGSVAIHTVDSNHCPTGPAIASQPWVPCPTPVDFQTLEWGGVPVPSEFVYLVNLQCRRRWGFGWNPYLGFDSDLGGDPGCGGGPPSCPLCYPCGRPNRSYFYGTAASPYCPGVPVEAEEVDTNGTSCEWRVYYRMNCTVGTEDDSWGKIKGLYR